MLQVQKFKKSGYHYVYKNIKNDFDLIQFLYNEAKSVLHTQFKKLFRLYPKSSWKYQFNVQVKFIKLEEGKTVSEIEPWFNSTTSTLYRINELDDLLEKDLKNIESLFDVFVYQGSGWVFKRILTLFLTVAKFYPLSGGKWPTSVLPFSLRKHNAIDLTSSSEKDRCFLQCINRYCSRHNINTELNISNLEFPTPINQIKLFEKRNGLSINVYGYYPKEARLTIYYHSKIKSKHIVDLLFWKQHYYLIVNLSRLIGKRWSSKSKKKFVCRSCLTYYFSETKFKQHRRFCSNDGQVYEYPSPDNNKLKFSYYSAMTLSDNVIYFDTESLLTKNSDGQIVHKPVAIGSLRVCHSNSEFNSKLFIHVGTDCVQKFIDWLKLQAYKIDEISTIHDKPLIMRSKDWKHFDKQTKCEMCKIKFDRKNKKCIDHDHTNSAMRFVLCNRCNLTYAKRTENIPCLCHNSMKYDLHFLIESLCKSFPKKFKIIGKTMDNYVQVVAGRFTFLDSFSFLNSSLSKLVESNDHFPLLKSYMGENWKLLCRKGIFPYDYMNSLQKLNENTLPPIQCFFDSLANEHVSTESYNYAKQVWKQTKCKSLKDYMVVYLKSDVLLLADVFEEYRNITYKSYQLDPTKFISAAHVGFHSMLKHTEVELELMVEADMVNFITNGIRGGVSSIINKYACANIKDVDTFDESIPSSEIAYFDACNMYGFSLSKMLPKDGFCWLTKNEIEKFDVMKVADENERGYILEVDLTYPNHLHDSHNELPLAPEKIAVSPAQYSSYMHSVAASSCCVLKTSSLKLIPHLGPRKHYVIHYQNLKYYLKMGLVLDHIHRVLSFNQSRWMKPYIDFNSQQRKKSKSEFASNFYKLMINSIYGKMLENPRNRSNYKLVSTKEQFYKYTRKPTFKNFTVYNPDFACIELKKEYVILNKPFAVGFTVLELSKLHLYQFHYCYIKKLYGNQSKLLFTDTDSLTYLITNSNVNVDMYKHKNKFDLSNFDPSSPFYSNENKKKIGTFKKEHPNDPIIEFIGLRAKMYSLKFLSEKDEKKAKGIKKSVIKSCSHKSYFETLFNQSKDKTVSFYAIRSYKHKLYTKKEHKKFLSPFDDKRYFISATESLAHNHFQITKLRCQDNLQELI